MNIILLLIPFVFAVEVNDAVLVKDFPKEPLLNEIIAFEPVDGHHFNLKAKNACGNGRLISATEEKVECQMYAPGKSKPELFICDTKETFCRREIVDVKTQSPSGFKAWIKYYRDTLQTPNAWSTPYKTGKSRAPLARGFANDINAARKQAGKEKKKVLVYFTQLSCGPCRQLKELVLQSDEFQEVTKDYIRLQVDIDVDQDPEWVKDLGILGTPTMIVLDKNFDELDRRVGALWSPSTFKSWLTSIPETKIQKLKDMPFEHKSKHIRHTAVTLINDEQMERLALWHYHAEPGVDKALEVLNKIKNKSSDVQFLIQLFATEKNKNNAAALETLKKLEPRSKGKYAMEYRNILVSRAVAIVIAKDKTLWPQAVKAVQAGYASATGDELQRALDQLEIDSLLMAGSEKIDGKSNAAYTKAFVAHIEAVPRLAGVQQTPYLEFQKAEALGDSTSKSTAQAQLREENKDDYSVDFREAYEAMKAGKFDAALVSIDKSLALAKDRSYQKAFLMKIEILTALQRQAEALKLIDSLLSETQLPTSTAHKVHEFVQKLRQKQRVLSQPVSKS